MTSELLGLLIRFNLVLGAAVCLVLLLRTPARLWFGARIAYALWLIPPLAAAMVFAPARVETVIVPAPRFPTAEITARLADAPPALRESAEPLLSVPSIDPSTALISLWLVGVIVSALLLGLRQWRFLRGLGALTPRPDLGADVHMAATTHAGPALIGVLKPIIITPADFEHRYGADERRIVLAHERVHAAHGDPIVNAFTALLQCVNWFNPVAHIAAHTLRVDQELACDAAVLEDANAARRAYAEAMLKTHTGDVAPLGCAWPPTSLEVLKERISMLKFNAPSRRQRFLGSAAIGLSAFAIAGAAWIAQPPHIVAVAEAHEMAPPAPPAAPADVAPVQPAQPAAPPAPPHAPDFEVELEGAEGERIRAEVRAEVRMAMEEARRDGEEARREIEEYRRAGHAEMGLDADEIETITLQAMEDARRAMLESAEHIPTEGETAAMMELQRHSQALAAQALEIAALAMRGEEMAAVQQAEAEARMEVHAQRIAELSMRIGAEASEAAERDVRIERRIERTTD